MFDKQQRKIKRSAKMVAILSKYGFRDVISRVGLGKASTSDAPESIGNASVYQRIRMILEELGPTFVKLGQSFSSREDLLLPELVAELQKLQDKVAEVPMNVYEVLENEFGISPREFFSEIPEKPIATASIAQVYKAALADGTPVILKIRKPGIQQVMEDDLLLLHDLVQVIYSYSDYGQRLNLKQAVATFEKSLLEELSLVNERTNIERFAQNFKKNKDTYVPKIFSQFCNNNVLCMEFIDGIKITDKEELVSHGFSLEKISEKGLQLYVSQILDYGFFHADPHAGNILVSRDGKIVFIDFGAVGQIQPNEKEQLESLISAFVTKNAAKIIKILKRTAVDYQIPDEKQFLKDVAEILNYIHSVSLQEVDVPQVINKMRSVLKTNSIQMPDYFYLLIKGIGLIEGVGRSINPDLDVVKSLRPYSKRLIVSRISPKKLFENSTEKLLIFADNLDEIPRELRSVLHKVDENNFRISADIKSIEHTNRIIRTAFTNLIFTMIICAETVAAAIFSFMDKGPALAGFSIFFWICMAAAVTCALVLLLRLVKR